MASETKPKDDALDAELSEEQLDGVSGGLAKLKVSSPSRTLGTTPEPHLQPTPDDGSPSTLNQ